MFVVQAMTSTSAQYFCIGSNKTGSTSLTRLMADWGFEAMPEKIAYEFVNTSDNLPAVKRKTSDLLRKHARSYAFFEDLPFCYRSVYKNIKQSLPSSKFILTTRDPVEWFRSCIKWIHSKNCQDVYNWIWDEEFSAENRARILKKYRRRNNEVVSHFRAIGRSTDLLVLPLESASTGVVSSFIYQTDKSWSPPKEGPTAYPWENLSS